MRYSEEKRNEMIVSAKALREEGKSINKIAWDLDIEPDTLRGWLDPNHAEKRRNQVKNARQRRLLGSSHLGGE